MKNIISWNKMVSASSVRNYLLKDTLSDWLKHYHILNIHKYKNKNIYAKIMKKTNDNRNNNKKYKNNCSNKFLNYIMNQGNKFEEKVYNELKNKYNCVKVAESYQVRDVEKFKYTIECMKKGYDIIYQGVFHSYKYNLYGCPDLLVRSDKLKHIFNCDIVSDYKSSHLGLNYHYVVIDVKHSTIQMASNGINIINSNSVPAYKGQVYIYNKILGEIQDYEPQYGYILGKKYQFKNYNNYNYLNQLAVIDYHNYDSKYIEEVDKAIKWLIRVREEGMNWNMYPLPSIPELYPNMKVNNYNNIKEKINNEIGEITNIWYCGIKNRDNCHNKDIYSWKDNNCNSDTLGFKSGKKAKIINNIININRNDKENIYLDELYNYDWDNFSDNKKEFYLDFETMDKNMSNLTGGSNQFIFMIGIGWEENNKWMFKCFYLQELNESEERRILNEFFNFIKKKEEEFNQESLLLHWTKAEPRFLEKSCSKYNLNYKIKDINFFDLYDLFVDNYITIKGCFNYSLKNVSRAMHQNNMINTLWDKNNPCSNGLNAVFYANEYYNNNYNKDIINNIVNYNEIDCKVMYEILKYLRKSYQKNK